MTPVPVLRDYVRANIPDDVHLLLTKYELHLLALKIMDKRGELAPRDSRILRTPLFGKAYVAEDGDVDLALRRVAVDLLPGSSLLRYI